MRSENTNKIWADIEGFVGYYQISDCGLVKSLTRIVSHSRLGSQTINERILRPASDGDGYLFVYLCKDGITTMKKISRLVGLAFVENPNNLPDINHKDGNKHNNNHWNLEWSDDFKNQQHAFRTGLNKARMGQENERSKLVMQIDKTGVLIATYGSVSEAERATGIKNQNISKCANGIKHHNTAGGYVWKYKTP